MRAGLIRAAGVLIAAYGIYALIRRNIPAYLFLRTQFVFFDFEEPLAFFFLDYLAVMGLVIFLGNSAAAALRKWGQYKRKGN